MSDNSKRMLREFMVFAVCLIVGMLLGRMLMQNWRSEVNKEVETVLNRVVMIDVPPIDEAVNEYLEKHKYRHKYFTTIDVADNMYGIYKIDDENDVAGYAHGKCVSTGNVKPGTYEIQSIRSHIDNDDVRYWRVVELQMVADENGEKVEDGDKLLVTSSGYEIADAPIEKVPSEGIDAQHIMIDSEVMLTVYDNSEPGIVLIVIDSKRDGDGGNKH